MTSAHDQYAKEYDDQIKNYQCYIAEVLFGLSYEYIKKGESLLDVGIGTGISAGLFNLAGLVISGIDGSKEMLEICKNKQIAKELIEQDLLVFPWPYQNEQFDHVISCGVFHFMGDLDRVFQEIARIQKTSGVFAFTVMDWNDDQGGQGGQERYKKQVEDGLDIFSHQISYIDTLLKNYHYHKEKEIVCFVGQTRFRAISARKIGALVSSG